jgi:hypothetical protein
MDEDFTVEATIQQMADRWGLNVHQLAYVVRTRDIPHARKIGLTRLFNEEQQKTIYNHFHRYLQPDAEDELIVDSGRIIADYEEEEVEERRTQAQRLRALEREVAELKALEPEIAALKAQLAQLLSTHKKGSSNAKNATSGSPRRGEHTHPAKP